MNIEGAVFSVTDVETTGTEPETDRVVECAVISGVMNDVDYLSAIWQSLFNPGFPIPPEASAVHHITDDDVKDFGLFLNVADEGWFSGDVMAAHFAEFETGFIPQIQGKPIVCTYRLARHLWPTLDKYGNQYLRYLHKIEVPEAVRKLPSHRAYPDAAVTACLLEFELQTLGILKPEIETVEQLIDWTSQPFLLHRITFGKYGPNGKENPGPKGRIWSDVPKPYLEWLQDEWDRAARKGEEITADVDTMFTVRHYLGL